MEKQTTLLTGKQKAAVLLISLGPEVSSQVFKHLSEQEIDQLTLEIANVRKVEAREKEAVINEFHQMARAQEVIGQGGIETAKDILEKALGSHKANDIINRLTSTLQVRPFDFARKADPSQILNILQHEHPQTIALVLSYLDSKQSAAILSALPEDMQGPVARRIALMDSTSPEVISQVEHVLEQKLSATGSQGFAATGGVESIVQVLSGVDRSTEKTILTALEHEDPELAEEIKKRMFVFEDIIYLDDRSMQRVIRDVENNDLQYALKVSSEDVKNAIFRNMSTRRSNELREEIDYMGPVRLKEVEEAQARIVSIIRRLEETGEVIVSRGGGDDVVV
jgi:flagellar motor switch protein FliG